MNTDFAKSLGILPLSYIEFRSFVKKSIPMSSRTANRGHTKRRKDTNKSRSYVLLVSFGVFSHFSILKCEKTRKDTPRDMIQCE